MGYDNTFWFSGIKYIIKRDSMYLEAIESENL